MGMKPRVNLALRAGLAREPASPPKGKSNGAGVGKLIQHTPATKLGFVDSVADPKSRSLYRFRRIRRSPPPLSNYGVEAGKGMWRPISEGAAETLIGRELSPGQVITICIVEEPQAQPSAPAYAGPPICQVCENACDDEGNSLIIISGWVLCTFCAMEAVDHADAPSI